MGTMFFDPPVHVSRGSGVGEVAFRLTGLINERRGVAQWWVDLTGQLDELNVRLMTDGEQAWRGLSDQLRRDAPHLSSHLARLDEEQQDLESELMAVRMLAGDSAGDPSMARQVKDAVRDLLNRIRRLEERTTQVMYEAYERDLGGESA